MGGDDGGNGSWGVGGYDSCNGEGFAQYRDGDDYAQSWKGDSKGSSERSFWRGSGGGEVGRANDGFEGMTSEIAEKDAQYAEAARKCSSLEAELKAAKADAVKQ